MTDEEFYGQALYSLKIAEQYLLEMIAKYSVELGIHQSVSPVMNCQSRIKSAESMIKKLRGRGLKANWHSALTSVYDAVGVRIICGFVDDVYKIAAWLEAHKELEIIERKDYFAWPKPNGYRSYHLCLRICTGKAAGTLAEIQIRTMAIDFWATLEHQLKYKKKIPCEDLIRKELKRCADEIAATDISMQTIRDMLENGLYEKKEEDTESS